jgi:hypothetical protein
LYGEGVSRSNRAKSETIAIFTNPLYAALSCFVGNAKTANTSWRYAETFRHVRTRVLNSTKSPMKTYVRKLTIGRCGFLEVYMIRERGEVLSTNQRSCQQGDRVDSYARMCHRSLTSLPKTKLSRRSLARMYCCSKPQIPQNKYKRSVGLYV